MQIRSARESDAVAIREIVERAYNVYIERIGRRPAPMNDNYAQKIDEGCISVSDEDGEIIGLIVLLVNLSLYSRLGYREDDRRTENGLRRVFFSKNLASLGA